MAGRVAPPERNTPEDRVYEDDRDVTFDGPTLLDMDPPTPTPEEPDEDE